LVEGFFRLFLILWWHVIRLLGAVNLVLDGQLGEFLLAKVLIVYGRRRWLNGGHIPFLFLPFEDWFEPLGSVELPEYGRSVGVQVALASLRLL